MHRVATPILWPLSKIPSQGWRLLKRHSDVTSDTRHLACRVARWGGRMFRNHNAEKGFYFKSDVRKALDRSRPDDSPRKA